MGGTANVSEQLAPFVTSHRPVGGGTSIVGRRLASDFCTKQLLSYEKGKARVVAAQVITIWTLVMQRPVWRWIHFNARCKDAQQASGEQKGMESEPRQRFHLEWETRRVTLASTCVCVCVTLTFPQGYSRMHVPIANNTVAAQPAQGAPCTVTCLFRRKRDQFVALSTKNRVIHRCCLINSNFIKNSFFFLCF